MLEREAQTGGIPRHSDHLAYGVRNLRRVLTGPAYARRLSASGRLFRVPEKVLRGADSARGPVTLHLR
ncbi:MAG: hypothetical protein ACJ711_07215 [Ornithinibacter sp.]